jgi:hypothetical protein
LERSFVDAAVSRDRQRVLHAVDLTWTQVIVQGRFQPFQNRIRLSGVRNGRAGLLGRQDGFEVVLSGIFPDMSGDASRQSAGNGTSDKVCIDYAD